MKHCPACHRRYDDAVKFCPHDGTVLPGGSDAYVGRRLMEQFDILAQCGEGAMGTVYQARQINMERMVAIKILRRDLVRDRTVVRRFYREAKAAARLSHPNIITVHLVAETDEGIPYIVMEHLEGTDLDSLCKTEAPLSIGRAVHLAAQIAAALSEAHQNDVVHRDLKPANIIVLAKSRFAEVVKVLDFGIAKILEAGVSEESRITKSGAIFGTPYYLSPEQATGAELDARADLYSLGVILYRMVTGHLPFESGSGLDILVRHVKDPPPPPRLYNPGIPFAMEKVILTALEKNKEHRFPTADAMRLAMLAAAEESGVPLAAVTPAPSSPWSASGGVASGVANSEGAELLGDGGKKTVAGFSSGAGERTPGLPPPVDEDPLVLATRRVAWGGAQAVAQKPYRESRPTVLSGPSAAQVAQADSPDSLAFSAARADEAPLASPASRGMWTDGRGGELDGEDLPGVDRHSPAVMAPAPAPVPKLQVSPLSGDVSLSGSLVKGPGLPPGVSSGPLDSPLAKAPSVALDSSPSVVTGQHVTPSQSVILAYRRAAHRGRIITVFAVVLALIALGVGGFFVVQDQRRGSQRSSALSTAEVTRPHSDASVGGLGTDASASTVAPVTAAGLELLRFSDRGLALRLSSDEALRQGHEHSLVLDLWVDGHRRPVEGAEVTVHVTAPGRRTVKVAARPAPLAGRYLLVVSLPVPGVWTGTMEVRTPSGQSWQVPVTLKVTATEGEAMTPRPMAQRRPRPHPRPMNGLPRPPPDDGPPVLPMLPRPPMDPPLPPPDPD